jgi:hypothetical protein
VILGLGALAGAIGSVIGVGSTVAGWLDGRPEGTVKSLEIQSVRPLTYGGWRSHENVSTAGTSAGELRSPGALITFNLVTDGYRENDVLPVRIIVHDTTTGQEKDETIMADPARVRHGKDCGCVDWVPVPPGRRPYFVEVAVYPPGPIRGDPLDSQASDPYISPAARRTSSSAAS